MVQTKSTHHHALSGASSDVSDSTRRGDRPVGDSTAQAVDPQVKPRRQYAPRRTFTASYKQSILMAYDACQTAQARGELLRREGLYHSRLCAWRSQQAAGKRVGAKKGKHAVRVDHLTRDNEQLKKKLAQAEAIIELQKKVSDLLGTHILSHETNGVNS